MSMTFDGKVALVTGSAAGFGGQIVQQLSAQGAKGVAFDRVEQDAVRGFIAHRGDVMDETSLGDAMQLAEAQFGRLDCVVANAGIVPPWRTSEEIDLDEWDRVFAVNVRGVIATIKQAVPALRRAGGGAIVAMASINAERAHARQCAYTASKHAVLGLVRATSLDLGRHGIRVNAVAPGPVATKALLGRLANREATGGLTVEEALSLHSNETALGRMVSEQDVADTVLYLLSAEAGGITGKMLTVDGGLA